MSERVRTDEQGQPVAVEVGYETGGLPADLADYIRAAQGLARAAHQHYRDSNPRLSRQAALVNTHLETALLFALFGDRTS